MPEPPLILVTNDDGVRSPGPHAAAEAVAGLGDLLLVALASVTPLTWQLTARTDWVPPAGAGEA